LLLVTLGALAQPPLPADGSSSAASVPKIDFSPAGSSANKISVGASAGSTPLSASSVAASSASQADRDVQASAASSSSAADTGRGGIGTARLTAADEKPVDWFARILGAVGLCIALSNFGYGVYKTRRDRRLSIEDDFWFRKIITPTTIEPMLSAFVKLLDDLPTRLSSEEEQREFALRTTKDLQRLNTSVQTLALFNEELPSKVAEKLRACEDTLADYSLCLTKPESAEHKTRAEVVQQVWKQLNEAMRSIQQYQLKH
jgi:hypothetical protein